MRHPGRMAERMLLHLLLVLALGAGCSGEGASESEGHAHAAIDSSGVSVETLLIEDDTQEVTRRYSGYAHPWDARGVGFLVAGRVTEIFLEEGERVRAGEPIATLDKEDFKLVRALAEAQIRALRPNLVRVRKLVASGSLPQMELDELQGRYDAAMVQKRQAERQLAHADLTAPVDGVVMERQTSEGQVIGAGMPVVVLLDTDRLKIRFGVTQNDLRAFVEGAEVTLTFPGVDEPRPGRIHHIALVPDERTRTYDVVVAVDNQDQALRPGMLAHLSLVVRRLEGLFVPLHAVERRNEEGFFVTVVERDPDATPVEAVGLRWLPGTAVERTVEVGEMVGLKVQVLSGLSRGDELVIRGQRYVRHGDRVRVLLASEPEHDDSARDHRAPEEGTEPQGESAEAEDAEALAP